MTYQEYTQKLEEKCGGRGGHTAAVNRFMSQKSPQYRGTIEIAESKDSAWSALCSIIANKDPGKYSRQY